MSAARQILAELLPGLTPTDGSRPTVTLPDGETVSVSIRDGQPVVWFDDTTPATVEEARELLQERVDREVVVGDVGADDCGRPRVEASSGSFRVGDRILGVREVVSDPGCTSFVMIALATLPIDATLTLADGRSWTRVTS